MNGELKTGDIEITEQHAAKIIDLLSYGLCSGVGDPEPGKMCVEAAVCYAMGLPHGDEPICVSPALRALKITINDAAWSDNFARAKGLKRLALIQLGSAGVLDDVKFARAVADLSKKYADRAAESAAEYAKYAKYAKYAEYAAKYAAESAKYAKYAAKYAAEYAAKYAEYAAKYAAKYAAESAKYAKYAAESAADQVLLEFCEDVVQILIGMDVPGMRWLYLAPLENRSV